MNNKIIFTFCAIFAVASARSYNAPASSYSAPATPVDVYAPSVSYSAIPVAVHAPAPVAVRAPYALPAPVYSVPRLPLPGPAPAPVYVAQQAAPATIVAAPSSPIARASASSNGADLNPGHYTQLAVPSYNIIASEPLPHINNLYGPVLNIKPASYRGAAY